MTEKEYKKELKDKLIEYRDCLNLSKDITFGIEIEYENIVKDTVTYLLDVEKTFNPSLIGWINKTELDIYEYNKLGEEVNGEISSKVLIDRPITWESLEIVLNLLERKGAIITNKCGGHVNVGSHILGKNKIYWRNFFLLWILYEDIIYNFSSGEFNDIRCTLDCYTESISYGLDIDKILNIKRNNYLYTLNENIFDKLNDIYISKPICNHRILGNRIEFRVPNGTLKKEIWQNYINFFTKFVIACKKELDIEKTLYKIKNKESNIIELVDYVFDNDLDKENFLIQTLKTNKTYEKNLPKHKYYY